MRIFGIGSCIILFIYLFSFSAYSQDCTPNPQICNQDKCGGVEIKFATDDNNVFCQGSGVLLSIDPANTTILDSFFVYWCDGVVGKYGGNEYTFTHNYIVPEDKVCTTPSSDYFVRIIGVKSCSNGISCRTVGVSVTLNHEPRARFGVSEVCAGSTYTFINNSCNVDESDPEAYLWTFHDGTTSTVKSPQKLYSIPGKYSVKLRVKNQCGYHETLQEINVVDKPNAVIELSVNARDSIACIGDTITMIDKSNQWSRTSWTFPTNNVFSDTLKWKLLPEIRKKEKKYPLDTIIYLDTIRFVVFQTGNLQFTLNSSNVCGTAKKIWNLKVEEKPTVFLANPPEYCETAQYSPVPNITGTTYEYLWEFPGGTPPSSDQKIPGTIIYYSPGIYHITFRIIGACDTVVTNKQLIVHSRDPVNIIDPGKIFCKNAGVDTLKADRPGGVWSGPGITNSAIGLFDPKNLNPGYHSIIYTVGPIGCQSKDTISLQVVNSQPVTVNDQFICEDNPVTQLIADPSTGIWSGNIAVQSNGFFDPAISGIGVFNINYSYVDFNNCQTDKNVKVTVEALPVLSISDTSLICIGSGSVKLNEVLQLSYNPTGGTITYHVNGAPVANDFDISGFGTGSLPVTVLYKRNNCEVRDTGTITFIEKTEVFISNDTIVCMNDSLFTFQTSVPGGIWQGPGINANTGVVNLKAAGAGIKTYTYIFQGNTSCEVKKTAVLNIKDPKIGLNAGQDGSVCYGPSSYSFTGFSPAGGLWSGTGIDPGTGILNLSQLKSDTLYRYKYCSQTTDLTDCEACDEKTFIIHSLPVPSFDINGLACIGEEIEIINTTAGNISVHFDLGDGTTSSQKSIKHTYSTKGTYIIRLEVTNQFGCKNSITRQIYVTTKPVSLFALDSDEGCAPFELNTLNQSSGDNISFEWNVANNNFNDRELPPLILDGITQDSVFLIQLDVSNECGTVSYLDSVLVYAYPLVNFGVSELEGCSPFTISFSNTSLGNSDNYFWDFGNGLTSSASIPQSVTYTTPRDSISIYHILLFGENECGTDSIYKTITVYPPDVTAFIESPGFSVCQFDSMTFSAFSTPGAMNTWKVIDPDQKTTGGSGNTLKVLFDKAGSYQVVLYASRCGTDTDTVEINVLPAPVAAFSVPDFGCADREIVFQNLSNNVAGAIWDFGDGNGSVSFHGTHKYTIPGTYVIRLTVFSLVNNCPHTIEKQIQIIGLPVASFEPSVISGCVPLKVSFFNNSTTDIVYDWDFGDNTTHSNIKNPTHIFENAGTYKTTLRVFDNYGCFVDTSFINIIVHPNPVCAFSFEDRDYCHRYDTIHFVNTGFGGSIHEWSINSYIELNNNFSFFPPDSGIYNIRLISSNAFGCADTLERSFQILSSPISEFLIDRHEGCMPLRINFQNESEFASKYIWDFGNGTKSIDHSPSYVFEQSGNYQISLISKSSNSCPDDTSSQFVRVFPIPTADFDFEKDSICGVPMKVSFLNLSQDNLDNTWLINSDEISQDPGLEYTFTSDGSYDTRLIVANEHGCIDSIRKQVDIFLQPIADFDVKNEVCEGETIVLVNRSKNSLLYRWTIEGFGTYTNAAPVIKYEQSGQYNVSLIAIYNEVCKDTFVLQNPIIVYDTPEADFAYLSDYDGNVIGEVSFNNLSVDFNSLLWDFGDGATSEELNPVHEYDINRDILVTLFAISNNGNKYVCIDTIVKPIAPEWITTFFAPNALSPEYGYDGTEAFKPVGLGIEKYEISIFSPWGEKVWYSDQVIDFSPAESWDGRYKGEIVPQGAYSWIANVTYVNGVKKVYKGSVTVVR